VIKVSVRTGGLLERGALETWTREKRDEIRAGVRDGLMAAAPMLKRRMRDQASQSMTIARRSFLNVFSTRLYDQQPQRLPSMLAGVLRATWVGVHESGGTVSSRGGGLLIPMNLATRIGPKRFRAVIRTLLDQGNAFFKNVNGKVILFAENISESSAALAPFKRGYRKAEGLKRLKRGQEIPIAVLVPAVQLRPRLRIAQTVIAAVPEVARLIETRLRLRDRNG
jgi:hypothetical protein